MFYIVPDMLDGNWCQLLNIRSTVMSFTDKKVKIMHFKADMTNLHSVTFEHPKWLPEHYPKDH